MKRFKKLILVLFLFAFAENITAQEINPVLTFEEYLGYVKEHHPLMKQANLTLSIAEANILRARGAFDPKIEVDYDRKSLRVLNIMTNLMQHLKYLLGMA